MAAAGCVSYAAPLDRPLRRGDLEVSLEKAKGTTLRGGELELSVQRVPPDATAFSWRDANFSTVIAGAWPDRADNQRNAAWVRRYHDALRPFSEEGAYVNFMGEGDDGRVAVNYGQNLARLQRIKARYDPGNLLRVNHNIAPAAASAAS